MTTHNVMRPCSNCLRMRQTFKDGMGRVFQRPRTHTQYYFGDGCGSVVVDNKTHKVVASVGLRHSIYLDTELYASKGRLISVETGEVLATYTRWVKLNFQGHMGN